MRLVCISDTHMNHRGLHLPEGDVLVHAGDATGSGSPSEVDRFLGWLATQPHKHKILVAGNHDWLFQKDPKAASLLLEKHKSITYLQDSGVEIDGVRFWGAPWQPWFLDWAFNLPRKGAALRETWNRIPIHTDVLITHGPPHGMQDQVGKGEHLGCEELKVRLATVEARLHIFGHIHDGYGVTRTKSMTFINASICTEEYRALNRPVVVGLHQESIEVHGIERNVRRDRLEALQCLLDDPAQGGIAQLEVLIPVGLQKALEDLADHRGSRPELLVQEYLDRGLRADLARQLRAANKSSKRSIPYVDLDQE